MEVEVLKCEGMCSKWEIQSYKGIERVQVQVELQKLELNFSSVILTIMQNVDLQGWC